MTVLGHLEQHPGINPPDFSAKVTAVDTEYIQLDCTNFYPMGGGQPADRGTITTCLLYTSPSPRDGFLYRMPSSA